MTTYQAFQFGADGSLEPTTRELIEPSAGQVRIRVDYCGICHTDSVGPQPGRVPGHEVVGHIDAVGDGVSGWAVGDRVGVGYLGGHCGVCDECRRGNFVNCTDQPYTGVHVDGGYAEVTYARQSGLVRIPDGLSSSDAAPLLCAGFTTYNALLKGQAKPGDLVAVQGIGGLGHLGLQYARKMGHQVVAIARGTGKAQTSLDLGAHHYLDSTADDIAAELQKLGGARVVVATAAAGSFTPLVGGLAHGGKLITVGATSEPIEISSLALIFGGVEVLGSLTGSSLQNEQNLRFAQAQGIRAVIEPAKFADLESAYARMLTGDARYRMVVAV